MVFLSADYAHDFDALWDGVKRESLRRLAASEALPRCVSIGQVPCRGELGAREPGHV